MSIHGRVSCILNAVDHSNETLKLAKEAVKKFNKSEALKKVAVKFDEMEFYLLGEARRQGIRGERIRQYIYNK